jgi:hypothetical protein
MNPGILFSSYSCARLLSILGDLRDTISGMNPGNLFSTYAYAQSVANQIEAAIKTSGGQTTNPDGSALPNPFVIADSINDPNTAYRDYAANFQVTPPASQPPPSTYTSIFELRGNVIIGGVTYFIQQALGSFGARQSSPDAPSGDKNFIQVGSGATAVMAPVIGTAVGLLLLPSETLIETYWLAPA